jgi:serine/threonine protein kinase
MEKYRKLKCLGRGQNGEVWLVEREDSSLAALKQVYIDDQDSLNLEVTVLEKLHHPHIIQFYESFVHEKFLCIVIDYAEGGDLSTRLKIAKHKGYKFTEPQIRKWFMQICIGLLYIHENKIIHRDLKSQNIFLTKSGDIKIGDFGISRVLNKSDEFANTSVGTPYYISPEVCKGHDYDYKADVWSLGCIIYELCTLRRPFDGDSMATVFSNILNNSPDPLPEELSESLKSCVFMMLEKNPSNRPSISKILGYSNDFLVSKRKNKSKKPYQKEISIKIPTPTNGPSFHTPKTVLKTTEKSEKTMNENPGALTNRNSNPTSLFDSLLKQCPASPIRPLLMKNFLKRKLGAEAFERICRVVSNSKDPGKLLHEEPWIFCDCCSEDNLRIIEVGISCGAFNSEVLSCATSTNKNSKVQGFPSLSRHASQ